MKDNRFILVGILIVILIGGVVIVFFGGQRGDNTQNIVSVPEINTVEESSPNVQESTIESADVETATNEPEVVVSAPKTELEATDPSTVNLVSGNVQFVEAFAFW